MNIFDQAGTMAIGSRLRIFSEKITEDAAAIYKMYNIPIEPKWWPVFYILSRENNKAITDIAKEIGHSHPSVSKIVREMSRAGLLQEKKDTKDKRKNLVSLSSKGQKVALQIEDTYKDVTKAVNDVLEQTRNNLWKAIDEFEYMLDQKNLLERVRDNKKSREMEAIKIIPFTLEYATAYKELNLEWIVKYFKVEQTDTDQLDNPEKYILSKGGQIFMAIYKGEVLGTCAMKPVEDYDDMYELAKMAVSPKARGMGIGWLLGQAIIEAAKELQLKKLYLESNTILKPALNLYRKMGFVKVTGHATPYERSNIQMELNLEIQ